MRRLRCPEPRPVHFASGTRSGMACGVPEVPGMQAVSGRELYVLCSGRQDILQAGLCKVRSSFFCVFKIDFYYSIYYIELVYNLS